MAETKAEKKKPGIVRQIFKWIGLGLLVLLIILGLIFQAPWKVIALLLIILAACTQLPRPARKWFWLSAAAVVIALIIWVFLPDWGEWKPYKYNFDKELADLNDKYAIPDEENAATIYHQLLENYDANTAEPNFLDYDLDYLTRREPWSSKDYPQVAEWLKGQQSTITKLLEASKIEKCRFPIPADSTALGQSMDRLAAMRSWAFLLIRAGNNDIAEGRTHEALEKYITVTIMGRHLRQQAKLIDLLVGIAVEAISYSPLKRFIVTSDATEKHLSVIEKALAGNKHNWSSDWPRILDYEKLIAKKEFAKYYELNPKGKIRLSRDPLAQMRASCQQRLQDEKIEEQWLKDFLESVAYPSYLQRKLIKANTIFKWFYVPSDPQRAAEIIDASYERYYAMAEPDFDWQKGPKKFSLTSLKLNFRFMVQSIVNILEESYYRIHDIYLRTIAEKRGARLIITLRRYKNKTGHWPDTLEDIKSLAPAEVFVDPINLGTFVYKLTKENFTLYSKGKNNIDENGQRTGRKFDLKTKQFVGKEKDDWLIWPPRSRKTKEENTDAEQQ